MPSFQSRLIRFVIKHRHLLRFQLKKKDVFDFNTSIAGFREDCEKGAGMFGKLPETIEVTPVNICHIKAEWIVPKGVGKDKVVFYTHGGGYVSGSCSDHRGLVSRIVKAVNIPALLFEYRLAPEVPFPGAIEDSVEAYKWVLSQGVSPSNIVIIGESAGGGLALATLLALKEKGIELPSAAVAVSPWTDLKCTGESYRTKNDVSVAPLNSWTVFSKYYACDNDPGNPLISPLYGDLHGLPPLLLQAGEDDELFDDSVQFAEKAGDAGVDVTFRKGKGMLHCYAFLPAFVPESREAMEEILTFIKEHIGKVKSPDSLERA
ncbi:MAG: alpha/beta hydrolase [Ignavibacteria bacterium]|jgi:acetyl esterase/lipase|nr:alpha/beta hydrolase [Ignavibacteria bacterium]MCU7502852.1 alpha/beta hydrolase [Ignavibacteria bacterium]MCU7515654.1 alpha/beta hydrolase [Ignavibacteria bacterium]